jgi:hypothetical protein
MRLFRLQISSAAYGQVLEYCQVWRCSYLFVIYASAAESISFRQRCILPLIWPHETGWSELFFLNPIAVTFTAEANTALVHTVSI